MSNNPAPRCPGCGKEMRLRQYNCDRGAVNAWYACGCGWSAPIGNDESIAYDKAMKRYAENPWISVRDELPKEGKYIVCTERGSVYCTRFYKGSGCEGIFKTDINTHITYWMPLPEPPKEGE